MGACVRKRQFAITVQARERIGNTKRGCGLDSFFVVGQPDERAGCMQYEERDRRIKLEMSDKPSRTNLFAGKKKVKKWFCFQSKAKRRALRESMRMNGNPNTKPPRKLTAGAARDG